MTEPAPKDLASPVPRKRGALALLGLLLCLLAMPAWYSTIGFPRFRSNGAAAWVLLFAGVLLAWTAARVDRRLWIRLLTVINTVLLAGFAWLFFVLLKLPATLQAAELATAPDFALESTSGATIRLSEELARGPVHLVFFRGSW